MSATNGKRRARRNYQREQERLTFYLETVIRIKAETVGETSLPPVTIGELKAYRDCLDYLAEIAGKKDV